MTESMGVARLIRDRLARRPLAGVVVHKAKRGGPFHRVGLVAKMHEEVCEVEKEPTDVGEYADLMEALLTMAALNGIKARQVADEMARKRRERGGFMGANFMYRTGP